MAKEGVSAEPRSARRRQTFHPGTDGPPLTELLAAALSEETWEAFSRGSAIRRAGRAGFARNVCVAIGNGSANEEQHDPHAVELLIDALSDPEPLVRGHAAWALGGVETGLASGALSASFSSEDDPWVREELALALGW